MRRNSRHHDSGAALVEMALVAPVLLALVFGIIEMGYMLRDYQVASDSVSDGSRVAAVMGPDMAADGSSPDFHIIRSLREATGSMGADWIQRIVIFKADRPTGGVTAEEQVPDDCKAGSPIAGRCNVYNDVSEAFDAVERGDITYFACPDSDVACSWPASERRNGPTVDAVDHLGVWMRVERPQITGLFGSSVTLEHASVVRVEIGALTG
ncbi:MAG TPA: hypothetical protein DCS55_10595 [Acidimicrobiaceae bacterium]|nr:hypothetical protein [Acidimicrobiaceae bacterium]